MIEKTRCLGILIGSISTYRLYELKAVSGIKQIVESKTNDYHKEEAYQKYSHVPDFGKMVGVPVYFTEDKVVAFAYAYDANLVTKKNIEDYVNILKKWGYSEIHNKSDEESSYIMYENKNAQTVGIMGIESRADSLFTIIITTKD